ncbi:Asp-tRNA(Asn)/Glu-tRNA(Gln) amidotransferase subunit GatC [Candidatus Woesearchaeota archaeon]|nr:Asp-tRNA(Asn)/Glu-tRNA(Gln) amidotransferase subunit GatC [Candidatus Woesearchaeota archaeon]
MKIDEDLIKHVAETARLNLTQQEIKEFLPQLKEILGGFSEISKVNTNHVKPSFHAVEIKDVLRHDIPKKPLTQEEALKNTKHKKDGYFLGPSAV